MPFVNVNKPCWDVQIHMFVEDLAGRIEYSLRGSVPNVSDVAQCLNHLYNNSSLGT